MPGTTEEAATDAAAPGVEQSAASTRPRREKSSKVTAASSRLEEIRQAKGAGKKYKPEVKTTIANVYDVVDEEEYERLQMKKREEAEAFLEEDGSAAFQEYYDDGHEVFEEDRTDEAIDRKTRQMKKSRGKKGEKEAEKPEAKSRDIRDMVRDHKPSKKQKEAESTELVNPAHFEALLAAFQDDGTPVKKTPTRYEILHGLPGASLSQSPFSQAARKTTGFRQTREPPPAMPKFSADSEPAFHDDPPEERAAVKRSPPVTPVKVAETAEQVRARMFAPKVTAFSLDKKTAPPKKARPQAEIELVDAANSSILDDGDDDMFANIDLDSAVQRHKPLNEIPGMTAKFGAMTSGSQQDPCTDFDDLDFTDLFGEESATSLRMYWLDACEDAVAQPGTVFLFGKCKEGRDVVSVCVKVQNIERRQYLLLRKQLNPKTSAEEEKLAEEEVLNEFNTELRHKLKVHKFRSAFKSKRYAFDLVDVPDKAHYLELRYPFTSPPIAEDYEGKTFSTVFGRTTSALEIFLLGRKLKGPCWLDISKAIPSTNRFSWCKAEYIVESQSVVQIVEGVTEPPPVAIMAVQTRSVVNSKTRQSEIVTITALVHDRHPLNKRSTSSKEWTTIFAGLSHPSDVSFPFGFKEEVLKQKGWETDLIPSERGLLSKFLAFVQRQDPDFIIFHEAVGQQLDTLLDRAVKLGVPNWSRLGRLKRGHLPKGRFGPLIASSGRIICDVKHSAQEHVHAKSYDLTTLRGILLKDDQNVRAEIPGDSVREYFRTSDSLMVMLEHTLMDALYCLQLMAEMNALPLALQITQIAGNILSRTLMGGRSERNEYLLLHAFTEQDYICPDKVYRDFKKPVIVNKKKPAKDEEPKDDQEDLHAETADALAEEEHAADEDVVNAAAPAPTTGKRKPAYAGGLVLDPKKGLYDTIVLLMDFNSLYPSIIQEFNICFTTIPRAAYKNEGVIPELPPGDAVEGLLPKIIKNLVERRKLVKQLLKNPKITEVQRVQFDIRQKGLKLTANSLYGCLGFANSRFFARHLAALITSQGREILMATKQKIEKGGSDVIYGDTDSLMINTHLTDVDAVLVMGHKIRRDVSGLYKCLELDVDGIFRSMLLLNKKKYAALVVAKQPDGSFAYSTEIKGLDVVRRDWSKIASDIGKYVIGQILDVAKQTRDETIANIQSKLQEVAARINADECTVEELTITKQLTKEPSLYSDVKSNPHVQIARRLNAQANSTRKFRAGDTIPYVICNEVPDESICVPGQRVPHTARGYHTEEYSRSNGKLTIDKQYYLAEQIHKVVNRLCEPIEGVDSAFLAECLGVDKSQFPQHFANPAAEEEDVMGAVPDEELYKDCLSLELKCPCCGEKWEFREPIVEKDGAPFFSLTKCLNCDEAPISHVKRIHNHIQLQITTAVAQYYKTKLVCEDANCHYQCSFIPPKFHRGQPICPRCDKAVLKPEFTDRDLYHQLCFWKNAFDPHRALEKIKKKPSYGILSAALQGSLELQESYAYLADFVQSFLVQSAYGTMNFSDFFSPSLNMPRLKTEFV